VNGFGEALRDLRSARGLSLRDLGRRVHYSHGYLHDLECGRKPPAVDVAAALDAALDGGGLLVRLAAGPTRLLHPGLPDWGDRAGAVVSGRLRPDPAVVGQAAVVLDAYRRMEDSAGSGVVLGPMLAHARTVGALRQAADGQLHDELLALESQTAQFVGWLHQDQAERAAAEQWYALALGQAHEVGDENMVASILSMRSNTAWGFGEFDRAVRLGEAACRPHASPGVLAVSQQQVARAYAAVGRRAESLAAVDRADELMGRAEVARDAEPPWVYFADPVRLRIQRAMCLRELGDYGEAVEVFVEAIAALPDGYPRDRGTYLARLAVTYALAGERDGAAEVAAEARVLAEATGSARTLAELARVQ